MSIKHCSTVLNSLSVDWRTRRFLTGLTTVLYLCIVTPGASFIAVAQTAAQPSGQRQPVEAAPAQPKPPQTQSEPVGSQSASPADTAAPTRAVLFSRDSSLDSNAPANPESSNSLEPAATQTIGDPKAFALNEDKPLKVSDLERGAVTFTAYDLDVHLNPASAGIRVRAALTVRNDGTAPLNRLVFQISSSLHWEAFSGPDAVGDSTLPRSHLDFVTRRVATDADHTGWTLEAVVTLPQPLAPGQSISITALYSGAIQKSAERLERIGAPLAKAAEADWDAIAGGNPLRSDGPNSPGDGTALRGFGDVLWYPVASPPLFLGDGPALFAAIGRAKLRQSPAMVRLRLAVEFVGDAPDAAFFCGRRVALTVLRDNPDLPAAESPGVATAVFDARPLGFRSLSLFVTGHPASLIDTPENPGLIAAVTDDYDALPEYTAAAALVEPLLTDWFGARPLTTLNLIDHPGQPFEEGALLVRTMGAEVASVLAPSLTHSLTHAWIHSNYPWIDEGLAQFTGLLWAERTKGRAAALDELQQAAHAVAFAEGSADHTANILDGSKPSSLPGAISSPESTSVDSSRQALQAPSATTHGEPLIVATSELYYRAKAAAVWWMLRGITGDEALKQALQAYRQDPKLDRDPQGFEQTLEGFSHKDLHWFFESWVDEDRGLPELTIVNVTPRQLDARNGRPAGWLISVDVRNDGDAVAEVPVIVRSAAKAGSSAATETQTLRIAGHSSISRRILFAGTPEEVQVNDGGVPEMRVSVHTRKLALPSAH